MYVIFFGWGGFPLDPCQPAIASAQTSCNTTEVQISWLRARGVLSYAVVAAGNLGYASVHNTTRTLLSAAFPCGQEYNVTVQGRGGRCDGPPSSPFFFRSGAASRLSVICLQGARDCLTSLPFPSSLCPPSRHHRRAVPARSGLGQLGTQRRRRVLRRRGNGPRRAPARVPRQRHLLRLERPALRRGVRRCGDSEGRQLHQPAQQRHRHLHGWVVVDKRVEIGKS